MEAPSATDTLFSEFAPVSAEAWKARIAADLKGADYEKTLTRATYEGFRTKPFYTSDDAAAPQNFEAAPGNFPFIRGKKTSANQWFNTPLINTAPGTNSALLKAKTALAGGAEALEFYISSAENLQPEDLPEAIDLTKTPVLFHLSSASIGFAAKLAQALKEKNIANEAVKCRIFFDPLTENLASENQTGKTAQTLPGIENNFGPAGITVNGAAFYNLGASLVQEIAFTLSAATEYAHLFTEAGQNIPEVLQHAAFRMAVGTNYFMEIAKLRALRLLWSAVVKSYKAPAEIAATLTIQSVSASWHQTLFDPHTNILRATTEAMSAIIGGCDFLTILPYDSETGASSDFPHRIARNISTILKEESYFGNAIDPAAGSYYIESLTYDLAEKAWNLFSEIESAGGYLQALNNGLLQQKIEEVREQKLKNLAKRKDNLTGTNQFAATSQKLSEELLTDINSTAGLRASSQFDLLRLRTSKFEQLGGKKTKIHLAMLGQNSMRKVRADFVQDFVALAGFESVRVDLKDQPETSNELANATCIVLCAADEDYAQFTDTIADTLKASGKCNLILLAGNPSLLPAGVNLAGIDGFIYMGADAIEVLTTVQMRLGIA